MATVLSHAWPHLFTFGATENADTNLHNPHAITHARGSYFVSDYKNHRVQQYSTSSGAYEATIGSEAILQGALGIAVYNDQLFVSAYDLGLVQVFSLHATSPARHLRSLPTRVLQGPCHLHVDAELDELYVTEWSSHSVAVIDVANSGCGEVVRRWGRPGSGFGEFQHAYSVVVVGADAYVVDRGNSRVQVFDKRSMEFKFAFGRAGCACGEFSDPRVIASGPAIGSTSPHADVALYISDDHRIQVFSLAGVFISVVAGSSMEGAGARELNAPVGFVVGEGRLVVADDFNNRIQVFGSDHSP
jgi:DNA-binding beta-propeller fold protein YncE